MILQLFVPILEGLLCVLIIVPLCIKVAMYFRLVDQPYSAPHKIHKTAVPKAGGIAIVAAVFLVSLINSRLLSQDMGVILVASIPIFVFGIWDDAKGLSAGWKLSGQVLATLFLVWNGVYVQMFGHPVLNVAITFLWTVGVTNAFNLVDSMDGLAVGLAAIASAFFMLVTVDAAQSSLAYLSALLLGTCVGVFSYNVMPARTFLGDLGAQFLGFVLAALAIAYTPPGLPQPSSWFVPILLLGIPIFDTSLVVISRLRRGLLIYMAGQDHTYHRLVRSGMSTAQAVTAMHVAALLIGCVAFVALPLSPLWANLIFALVLLGGAITLVWLEKIQAGGGNVPQ
jgi:UDP-GlcNAc:undecaprenyl-phosphate GlcNAc-1-phosphate transferase